MSARLYATPAQRRLRLLDATLTVARDPHLHSTRARLVALVERLHTYDPAVAEALCQLLPDATDAELPSLLPDHLPSLLQEQVQ